VTVSSGLVHPPLTASSHPRGACAVRLLVALACQPSVPELAAPASVVLHRPASACCQAVREPSFSSAAEAVVADSRRTGRALAAAAAAVGSRGRDPSGCRRSCSSAAVVASTSVVVGSPETTCRPADGMAAAARHTDQARTAAEDCMVALGTHKNTHRNATKKLTSIEILQNPYFMRALYFANSTALTPQ